MPEDHPSLDQASSATDVALPRRADAAGDVSAIDYLTSFVDVPLLQSMMDDFYDLTHIPMSLIDMSGTVIVGAGWQEVCTRFHRANPATCANCTESDIALTSDIPAGEARLYKCKNGMWDAATPVTVGGRRLGTVFTGQFFFDDESIDIDFFAEQARRHGFDEHDYLSAVEAVPRLSHADVDVGLRFLTKLATMIAELAVNAAERQRASQTARRGARCPVRCRCREREPVRGAARSSEVQRGPERHQPRHQLEPDDRRDPARGRPRRA